MNSICLLGSTGSIGTQTIDVVRNLHNVKINALCCNSNIKLLENQVREFNPKIVCIYDVKHYNKAKLMFKDMTIKLVFGNEGLLECVEQSGANTLVNSLVGMIGLLPTVHAIKKHMKILIANKETLVVGGDLITNLAKKYNVEIVPIDSEHSAILQCIKGNNHKQLNKIILTASGGPFLGKSLDKLKNVTVNQALNHPNWVMGRKISIDSATLMNKGLEFIEAKYLFSITNVNQIEVVVHPQSIVHSMVEFIDKSIIAQLSCVDMRLAIQYAITHPDRQMCNIESLDLTKIGKLTFEKPDIDTFICLKACIKACEKGGLYPAIVNAANEVAVELFLNNKISFIDIGKLVYKSLDININFNMETIQDIIKADNIARDYVISNI